MAAFVTTDRLRAMVSEAESLGVFLCGIEGSGQLTGLGKQLEKIGSFDLTTERFSRSRSIQDFKREHSSQPSSTRTTGKRFFEHDGEKVFCKSNKQLLKMGLIYLEEKFPGTLKELHKIRPRSKRIVSKNRYELFRKGRDDLAENNSEILIDDWWVGTNNSSQEVAAWLQRACDVAGVKFDSEFKIGGT